MSSLPQFEPNHAGQPTSIGKKPLPELLPARMLNEFVYCPRLFYYEWVEGVFESSVDTEEGRARHRRVDAAPQAMPLAEAKDEKTRSRGEKTRRPRASDPRGEDEAGAAAAEPAHETGREAEATEFKARSIELSSERLGLIARLDVVEGNEFEPLTADEPDSIVTAEAARLIVRPVDYKKGRPMDDDGVPGAWPSDRIQIAVQVLLLRDNGYACEEGMLYYAATKQRVRVAVTPALEQETLAAVAQARAAAAQDCIPPPLVDSPKCPRCSLVGICLPDETNALRDRAMTAESPGRSLQMALFSENGHGRGTDGMPSEAKIRQLISARDDLRPLYLNSQGVRVGKSGEVVQIKERDSGPRGGTRDKVLQEVRLGELNQINLFGNVQLSTQVVHSFCQSEIPICYFSQGGWFYGITTGLNTKNVFLRRTQFRAADNAAQSLQLARALVAGKIRNQRTLLQRNHLEPPADALRMMKALIDKAETAPDTASLLGIEGAAARAYFEGFAGMLKAEEDFDPGAGAATTDPSERDARASFLRFDFSTRNRRPPRDPVNALLSLAYSLLAKDLTITCFSLGMDPYWGFYHQPRFGRPALALDLMEPFRPLIADSAVLSAINTRMVTPADFVQAGPAVALKPEGRKAFFRAYEMRMDALVTHPLLDYRVSYRRMLEIQARLLARYLGGEMMEYPVFVTR